MWGRQSSSVDFDILKYCGEIFCCLVINKGRFDTWSVSKRPFLIDGV